MPLLTAQAVLTCDTSFAEAPCWDCGNCLSPFGEVSVFASNYDPGQATLDIWLTAGQQYLIFVGSNDGTPPSAGVFRLTSGQHLLPCNAVIIANAENLVDAQIVLSGNSTIAADPITYNTLLECNSTVTADIHATLTAQLIPTFDSDSQVTADAHRQHDYEITAGLFSHTQIFATGSRGEPTTIKGNSRIIALASVIYGDDSSESDLLCSASLTAQPTFTTSAAALLQGKSAVKVPKTRTDNGQPPPILACVSTLTAEASEEVAHLSGDSSFTLNDPETWFSMMAQVNSRSTVTATATLILGASTCSTAILMPDPLSQVTVDTTDSTLSVGALCGSMNNAAWFSWVSGTDSYVKVDTFGTSYQTTIEVYEGNCPTPTPIVTDPCDTGTPAKVQFWATPGTTYRFLVGDVGPDGGDLTLRLRYGSHTLGSECTLSATAETGEITLLACDCEMTAIPADTQAFLSCDCEMMADNGRNALLSSDAEITAVPDVPTRCIMRCSSFMTDATSYTRITQQVIEGMTQGDPSVRITQQVIEGLTQGGPSVRTTQQVLEGMTQGDPSVRITQQVIEVLTQDFAHCDFDCESTMTADAGVQAFLACDCEMSAMANNLHGVASLTCVASITAHASEAMVDQASLHCVASMSSTGHIIKSDTSALHCVASMSSTGHIIKNSQAALHCVASMSATAESASKATLHCISTMTAEVVEELNASLHCASTVTATGKLIRKANGVLHCASTVTANGSRDLRAIGILNDFASFVPHFGQTFVVSAMFSCNAKTTGRFTVFRCKRPCKNKHFPKSACAIATNYRADYSTKKPFLNTTNSPAIVPAITVCNQYPFLPPPDLEVHTNPTS